MKNLLTVFLCILILGCKKADDVKPEVPKFVYQRDSQNETDSIQKVCIEISEYKSEQYIDFIVVDKNNKTSTHKGKYRYQVAGKLDYYELPEPDNFFIIQREEPKDSILWAILNKELMRFYISKQ